jgi:hypothetical protein
MSAKAQSMAVLIGGGVLIGTTLSTISIVQAIPSCVLVYPSLVLLYDPNIAKFCLSSTAL